MAGGDYWTNRRSVSARPSGSSRSSTTNRLFMRVLKISVPDPKNRPRIGREVAISETFPNTTVIGMRRGQPLSRITADFITVTHVDI